MLDLFGVRAKRTLLNIGKVGGAVAAAFGAVKGGSEAYKVWSDALLTDVSGKWCVTDTIQESTIDSYRGLEATFEIFLQQKENAITGSGRKTDDSTHSLKPIELSNLEITVGRIDGDSVKLRFLEKNDARPDRNLSGSFDWNVIDRNLMEGRFSITAAKSSGRSTAHRC